MYNTDIPTKAELPTTAQLAKSTILAVITAITLLVTVVLPAEYAVDPTGIGRVLQLTQKGEIKRQLAEEAAADRLKDQQSKQPAPASPRSSLSDVFQTILGISSAQAQTAMRTDEVKIELKPTEGSEWKMSMKKDAQVQFTWSVQGGVVNYDMHASPSGGGKETSYKAARGVAGDQGVLTAGFDGTHGWFFRNRGTQPVTITLKVSGAYGELKRVQ